MFRNLNDDLTACKFRFEQRITAVVFVRHFWNSFKLAPYGAAEHGEETMISNIELQRRFSANDPAEA